MFTISFCSRHAFAKMVGSLFGVGVFSFLLNTLKYSSPILSFVFLLGLVVSGFVSFQYYKVWKMARYVVKSVRKVMEIEGCSIEEAFEYLSSRADSNIDRM